ncbi:hypothetical protein FAU76_00005 [Acinetobacter baumannii]|nr:hypothetical protein FAU76_00005 [Acinetobacter baumannii]
MSGATMVFGTVALPDLSAAVALKLSPFKYALSRVIEYLPVASAVAVPTTVPAAFLTVTTAFASVIPATTLPAASIVAVKLEGAVVSGATIVFGTVALPDLSDAVALKLSPFR